MAGLRQRLRVQQQNEVIAGPGAGRSATARGLAPASAAGPRLGAGTGVGLGGRSGGPFALQLAAVLLAGVVVRLPGITATPLDTPSAPQATLAAFVRGLGPGTGHGWVVLPWQGPMAVDLTGGLPLFAWAAALLDGLGHGASWPGRAISVAASLVATGLLFAIVRRLAGGRAALYAALFFTIAPLSLYYGRAYLPDALGWLLGLAALGAALRWRDSCLAGRTRQGVWWALAALMAGLAVAVAPGQSWLLVPLLYIAWPRREYVPDFDARLLLNPHYGEVARQTGRAQLLGYALIAILPLLLWQVAIRLNGLATPLDPALGGGPGAVLPLLTSGPFYGLLLGGLLNNGLTVVGFLLVLAGLGHRARAPWPLLFHLWLLGALGAVLLQAPRLANDESVLTPLLPALAAFAGVGAAWLARLPAQIAVVLHGGEEHDLAAGDDSLPMQAEFAADSAAVLTARPQHGAVRRQGWHPADPTGAVAGERAAWERTRGALLVLGHVLVLGGFAALAVLGFPRLLARYGVDAATQTYAAAGAQMAGVAGADRGLVVVGPGTAEIFYSSGRTGWTVAPGDFSRERLDRLHTAGAGLLASVDQAWLGRRPEYAGLLASFRVAVLDKSFIVFDLNTPPDTTDRRYFLETGHTLRGGFRTFWEDNGGLGQFGFPLTEELQLPSPEDGVVRTIQVFERAVFELHDDVRQVMLAPLGRRLAAGRTGVPWNPIAALPDAPDRRYFPETGHSVRGAFLPAWNERGGLALLGFPISQEVQEVDPGDGKVHTVQYFERARFEWHPAEAGTPTEVQLGLLGKEWWERRK